MGVVLQPLRREAAADVVDLDGADGKALAWHQFRLHPARRADEQKFRVGQQPLQPPGDAEGGVDVAGGAPAGKQEFHV